ncbi:hypothetical protein M3A49_41685 [Paraburkholderia sp. CNPSo 3076]|uniref:hypothetical protein n=1 Tax=Paraburkholderia sp. CNPSo 3076 TaxID=2940936 RepID=UPI002252587C|nr:hypothetical protein [Paraburkholderia sp. CNPSo 3076]MCX5545826.1 hypothetical protein [Paraburkholderia sp. CNPSo 3076]
MKVRAARPDIRVLVYDHDFTDDLAWFRFAFKWTDTATGPACSRVGLQLYRLEAAKLAETWVSLMPLGRMSRRLTGQPESRHRINRLPAWKDRNPEDSTRVSGAGRSR